MFEHKILINNNSKTQFTLFINMQLKSGFSVERKCYVYNISVSVSPFLSPSTYIQWRAVRGEDGSMSNLQLLRTLLDLSKILSENFPNYRSVGQSRFTQQAVVVIFSCLTYKYGYSIKGYRDLK